MVSDAIAARFADVATRLADVQEALGRVPAEDFARRRELRDEEATLRATLREISATWTDHLSIDQLQHRIALVEQRIADHYANRLSHSAGPQTGFGGGMDPTILHWMNRAMDQTANLPAMKAELARLKDKLAKLEGN